MSCYRLRGQRKSPSQDALWYYGAINTSNDAAESTAFIKFMLSAIKTSLIGTVQTSDAMSDGKMDKKTLHWQKIEQFLQTHEYIMNADVRALCGASAATANRLLAEFAFEWKLVKYRESGHWAYSTNWQNTRQPIKSTFE